MITNMNYSSMSTSEINDLLDQIQIDSIPRDYILHMLFITYASKKPGKSSFLLIESLDYIQYLDSYLDKLFVNNSADAFMPDAEENIDIFNEKLISFCDEQRISNNKYDLISVCESAISFCGIGLLYRLNSILSDNGIYIVHGAENYSSYINITLDNMFKYEDEIFMVFRNNKKKETLSSELIKNLIINILCSDMSEKKVVKKLLRKASEVEKTIQKRREEDYAYFQCYKINEIKNALLDIYIDDTNDMEYVEALGRVIDEDISQIM